MDDEEEQRLFYEAVLRLARSSAAVDETDDAAARLGREVEQMEGGRVIRAAIFSAAVAFAVSCARDARAAETEVDSGYGRDLISVVTNGRHAFPATANCLVWINAEGLGVGPKQLGGLHGLAMNINPNPMPGEPVQQPITFESGLTELKVEHPQAPAWVFRTIEKSRAAIVAGCAEDHETPFRVRALSRADIGS